MNVLTDGYSVLAPGKIASVVTCLEMRSAPIARPEPARNNWELVHKIKPDHEWYSELYKRIGSRWLWFSRLSMTEVQLRDIIHHPDVEIYALSESGTEIGFLELDFRQSGECELVYLGLTPETLGKGAGRWLMNRAIQKAWSRPMQRFWVHTCTLDHPDALEFYTRSGFVPYARQIEIADDPRVSGKLPIEAAPQTPII